MGTIAVASFGKVAVVAQQLEPFREVVADKPLIDIEVLDGLAVFLTVIVDVVNGEEFLIRDMTARAGMTVVVKDTQAA